MVTVSLLIKTDKSIDIVDSGNGTTLEDQLSLSLAVKGIFLTDCPEGTYMLNLCVHDYENELNRIISNPTTCMLGQDYFLQKKREIKKSTGCNHWLPIIHLCEVDIFKEPSKILNRYAFVMDNSIWNYFLSYKNDNRTNGVKRVNKDKLHNILSDIVRNYPLYKLNIAKEYAELNARLVSESFPGAGHSLVVPFIFHSEQKSQLALESLQSDGKSESLYKQIISKNSKWRILLVDDKATVFGLDKSYHLSTDYDMTNSIGIFKKDIIVDRLVDIGFPKDNIDCVMLPKGREKDILESLKEKLKTIEHKYNHLADGSKAKNELKIDIEDQRRLLSELEKEQEHHNIANKRNKQIEIWCASNIHDALEAMKEYEFEIILLDYLLDEQESGTEYGYEIFKQLLDATSEKEVKKCYKLGPYERLFFMFISAFTMAVNERLLAENISRSEKVWFIAEGACPTNTPKLFDFHLLKLFMKRLNDSGILKLSSNEIFKLIDQIFQDRESVRKRANALYQKVLSLQYHYRSILKDVEIPFGHDATEFETKGSVLMTNFIRRKINLGGMLEHLTQLVHLTAFGTIRQWPEMWEEYIYFKAQFEKQLDEDNEAGEVDCKKLFSNIEDYILKLKSQQR